MAGARWAFAGAAAKRAAWTEIAGESGSGCVGEERRTRVLEKTDERDVPGDDVGSGSERLVELLREERRLTVAVLAHLGEVEARRLYLPAACSSMHVS